MASTDLPDILAGGNHAGRPAATDVAVGATYSCTTHNLEYQSDGATWSTRSTFGGGVADQGSFTYFDATEAAAPGTPATGKVRLYAKTDGRIYSKDDAGVEYGPFDVGGGSDPRDYPAAYTLDDIAIGGGIEFDDAAGLPAGMTAIGTIASTDYAAMPGLDLLLDHGEHLSMADPGGDLEVMLHFSDAQTNDQMHGIGFLNSSGTGHCFVQYQQSLYQMGVTTYQYSATGGSVGSQTVDLGMFGHQWIAVKRVGTTLTARMSRDGTAAGFSSATAGVTNSTSTQIVIGRFFSSGGKKLRVHRLVIATPDLGV